MWRHYDITTQPAFIFIGDDGTTSRHVGGLGVDGLTEMINDLTS